MTAREACRQIQIILGLPAPQGLPGTRTRALINQLFALTPVDEWPPTKPAPVLTAHEFFCPAAPAKNLAEIRDRVLWFANHFAGLTEMVNNEKWNDEARTAELLRAMSAAGWEPGWSYCASFCEAAWRFAYQARPELPRIAKILTPGAVQSFQNARDAGITSDVACEGSIVLWQHGQSWQGHAGLVVGKTPTGLMTIEGNTGPTPGTIREAAGHGDGIFRKTRNTVKPGQKITGSDLTLLGFIPLFESA